MVQATADTVSSAIPKAASHTEFARAKINLALHVLERRDDGYHLLDSLVVFAEAGDTLTAFPDNEGFVDLDLGGLFAGGLDPTTTPDTNLVLAAAKALCEAYPGRPTAGLKLHLDKQLPVAAGLGGGSADAAAALRLLARFWDVDQDIDLLALAARLGADVPVCLGGETARMTGIGERLERLGDHLSGYGVVLANPGPALATAEVFAARRGPFSAPADDPLDPLDWRNDLAEAAVGLCPAIGEVLAALGGLGAIAHGLSGSGATCWALLRREEAALAEAAMLSRRRPGWWVAGGRVL